MFSIILNFLLISFQMQTLPQIKVNEMKFHIRSDDHLPLIALLMN